MTAAAAAASTHASPRPSMSSHPHSGRTSLSLNESSSLSLAGPRRPFSVSSIATAAGSDAAASEGQSRGVSGINVNVNVGTAMANGAFGSVADIAGSSAGALTAVPAGSSGGTTRRLLRRVSSSAGQLQQPLSPDANCNPLGDGDFPGECDGSACVLVGRGPLGDFMAPLLERAFSLVPISLDVDADGAPRGPLGEWLTRVAAAYRVAFLNVLSVLAIGLMLWLLAARSPDFHGHLASSASSSDVVATWGAIFLVALIVVEVVLTAAYVGLCALVMGPAQAAPLFIQVGVRGGAGASGGFLTPFGR